MRRAIGACVAVFALLMGTAGCGSDAGGRAGVTLRFRGFNGDNITQADAVHSTTAEVDVCQNACASCSGEYYTQTSVNAALLNVGKADIYLDSYTVSMPPEIGIPDRTVPITVLVPGGRCGSSTAAPCGSAADCGTGQSCVFSETDVNVLLYDFDFKDRVRQGVCPTVYVDVSGQCFNGSGSIIPQTLTAFISFSGVDLADQRFEVGANFGTTFADYANACGG